LIASCAPSCLRVVIRGPGRMVSFAEWIERAHGGGRKCPAIFRPGLESLNEADEETLMTNVTVRESNLETQRVVWTSVAKSIKEGIVAAHVQPPSDLQMLSFVAWAASPPDGEGRDDRDAVRDEERKGGGGRKPRELSLMPGGDGDAMWGRAQSKEEIKALPRLMREPVEEQEAPGVAALVVLSVSLMFGGKVAVEECEGALFGESPMGALCFKKLAKLGSMSGIKTLPAKIEEAKRQQDVTGLETHFNKVAQSLMRASRDPFAVESAAFLMQLWQDVSTLEPDRPAFAAFWFEIYLLETHQGKGLPRQWSEKMLMQARRANDSYSPGGGGGSRRAAASGTGGGGDATAAKVLERLEAMAGSMQSLQASVKGIKEAQTGLERKVSSLKTAEGASSKTCFNCGETGHYSWNCPHEKKEEFKSKSKKPKAEGEEKEE
jgi:GNAT superfamily N-acetyltransferase